MSTVELDPALVEAIKGQTAELRRYRETTECRALIAQLDERDRIAAMIADQVAAPLRNVLEQEAVVRQLRDRLYDAEARLLAPAVLGPVSYSLALPAAIVGLSALVSNLYRGIKRIVKRGAAR